MKLWKRRILLILAFSLFFVIAPILVFYAIGYRYDFKNKSFRQIGMIILESKPENADIFINNKYEAKTPFRMKSLLPNEYDLKIDKEGFNAWEKKLSVTSKKVTWASNIVLFFKEPEIKKLSDIKFNNFSISPNYQNIIASSADKNNPGIWLIDIETKKSEKFYPKDDFYQNLPFPEEEINNLKYSDFIWSPNSKKIVFTIKTNKTRDVLIIDTNKEKEPLYINSSFDLKTKSLQWKNNEEIYLLDESGNLHQIELNFKYAPKIIAENIVDFKYNKKNNEIVYILKEDDINKLSSIKGETKNNILNLPKDEIFEIEIGKYNNITLLLKNKKELLLIDSETKEPKIIGNNVNAFKWSKNENMLLFFGNNELWFYDSKKENNNDILSPAYGYNESNLITRYSTEIIDANWYPNEEYITILLKNNIKIIELDGRDKRNYQEFKNNLLPKNHYIEFDKKGENIYLINKDDILQEVKITEF